MITFFGGVVVLGVLLAAYFGAEDTGDPNHRTVRARVVDGLAALMAAAERHTAAQRRGWESYEDALRPWEQGRS